MSILIIIMEVIHVIYAIMIVEFLLLMLTRLNIIQNNKYIQDAMNIIEWMLEPIYTIVGTVFGLPREIIPTATVFLIFVLSVILQLLYNQ